MTAKGSTAPADTPAFGFDIRSNPFAKPNSAFKSSIILCKTNKQSIYLSTDFICPIIFLTAVTVRLFKLMIEPLLLRDCALYLRAAEIWNNTGDYSEIVKVPPLPLWCIKSLINFCGDAEISGRSLSVFLGGLICVTGYFLAKEITHNIWISIVAAVCFVFHPQLVFYSTQPLRENYFILLIGLLLIAMIRNFRNPRLTRWFICGALIGVAFFCRLEALEFIVIIIAELLCLKLNHKKGLPFFMSVCLVFFGFVFVVYSLLLCTYGDYSFMHKGPSVSWTLFLADP